MPQIESSEWTDMPEPKSMLTLSWEDIYSIAEDISQNELQRNPTQEEIKELFSIISQRGMDPESGMFWGTVEVSCQEYYDNLRANN